MNVTVAEIVMAAIIGAAFPVIACLIDQVRHYRQQADVMANTAVSAIWDRIKIERELDQLKQNRHEYDDADWWKK